MPKSYFTDLYCFFESTASQVVSAMTSFSCLVCGVKGRVHRKVLKWSTQPFANGAVGEVFDSTKHFWSFRGKQHCSHIQYNESNLFKRIKKQQKKNIKCLHTARPYHTIFESNLNIGGLRTLGWHHRSSREADTSIVLDLAGTLFTPETPKVFFSNTSPTTSISRVVRR